ncbi:3'(2'), 5'-bisphosphate nucleotidase/myo-inositol-1(or 4)-monophosphatase [Spinactinospora alkalitolerans]|uniref:inositol-phosphate phosphatase n=1 Tax=Spinactinospora alkalitolerans TaxID=687207 RepID=A0A852TQ08_9ACTN|nr:inositol monophosphatase family protein [Spinactinospora alkalitolerans]NYE46466.1 3'(2'), 5'-bisphosphate nucleotidase/myo-inositol-1(or 4)-monophosphatase [Spinactinospora alkalitolerans]
MNTDRPGRIAHELADALSWAVLEVGVLLREWRADSRATSGSWEGLQFKAGADAMAHDALSSRLRAIDPGIPVLSEEDPASLASRPDRYWLIDPVDGTASYAHGFPGYVTQAALMADRGPVLSAIYAPEPDVMYAAVRGMGATANGHSLLPCGAAPPGSGTLIDNTPEPRGIARAVHDRFGYTAYLECGSISLKLCRIAEGSAHLFVKDVPVRDWDVAAPELLLAEVGGALRRLDGSAFDYSGGFEHTGLIGAADPATCAAVARWYRESGGDGLR